MNKWTILLAVALPFACSQTNNKQIKEQAATTSTDNHIYFLSIGNAHYLKDESGKIEAFMNVSGANTSADYFYKLFSCYGKGLLLKSTRDRSLSKQILNRYLDSIINIAVKDSMSTTFIYYCGHGFSDNGGNIFLVPGDHHYDQSGASLASLLTIDDIQQKINDAINKTYYRDALSLPNDPLLKRTDSIMNAQMAKSVKNNKSIDLDTEFQNVARAVEKHNARFQRPRFILIADCCTEDINKVNYELLTHKEYKKGFEEGMDRINKMNPAAGKQIEGLLNATIYNMSIQTTRSQMWMRGNRTVYTAEIGKLAPMVVSPINEEEEIGPICRRLTLFYNSRKSFTIAKLLTSLIDEKLDNLSTPPRFEDGSQGRYMEAKEDQFRIKNEINAEMYLENRDSVTFSCK